MVGHLAYIFREIMPSMVEKINIYTGTGSNQFQTLLQLYWNRNSVVVSYRNQAILKNIDLDLPTLENSFLLKLTFSPADSVTKTTD